MADKKSYIYNGLALVSGFDVIIRIIRYLPLPLSLTYHSLQQSSCAQAVYRSDADDVSSDKSCTIASIILEFTNAERKYVLNRLRTQFFMWLMVVLVPLVCISININQKSQLWFVLPVVAVLMKLGFQAYCIRLDFKAQPGRERNAALMQWILSPGEWVPR